MSELGQVALEGAGFPPFQKDMPSAPRSPRLPPVDFQLRVTSDI